MSLFSSKLKPQTPSQIKLASYDETHLKISVVGGQTQLCPIKLTCQWAFTVSTGQKPPELNCKWFNKTETQIVFIEGIGGSYYQPCIADVGTIIHVQCMPQLEDVQYEGMPIIKQIGPIKIDAQTQQEANDLLSARKATFSIKFKPQALQSVEKSASSSSYVYYQGLLKIVDGHILKIISKIDGNEKQIIVTPIYENNLQFKCSRVKGRQIEIKFINKKQLDKISFELSSNKIRDVFVLLAKLIGMQKGCIQDNEQNTQAAQVTVKQQEKQSKIQPSLSQAEKNVIQQKNVKQQTKKPEQNSIQTINTSSYKNEDEIVIQCQKNQKDKQHKSAEQNLQQKSSKQYKSNKSKDDKEHQQKINHNTAAKKTQHSQQYLQEQSAKKSSRTPAVSQIKSSQDLSSMPVSSPTINKKTQSRNQTLATMSSPQAPKNAPSTLQLLQLTSVKSQLRTLQHDIIQHKKALNDKNEQMSQLNDQIQILKQRQASLNMNYFLLEDEMKKYKQNNQKHVEQLSYYKNQNRIVKAESQGFKSKIRIMGEKIAQLQSKLEVFLGKQKQNEQDAVQEQVQGYLQLKQKYTRQVKLRQQIQAKYQYTKQQSQSWQQKIKQLHQQIERLESEKNFFKKKYQNISHELQLILSSPQSPQQSSKMGKDKQKEGLYSSRMIQSLQSMHSMESSGSYQISNNMSDSNQINSKMQAQILTLKKSLKQQIDQNNFLRSITVGVNHQKQKQKKSSPFSSLFSNSHTSSSSTSKQHLKLQLLQLKKIVNKLTETIGQKDLALQNMRNVNKELGERLVECRAMLDQRERQNQRFQSERRVEENN